MFIPPNHIKNNFSKPEKPTAPVRLKASHVIIQADIAAALFGQDQNVHVVYYADRRALMVAPKTDELFKQLHKAKPFMLKSKNAEGDKSIAINEILLDNEVNDTDRDLDFESQEALKVLTIFL